jgi:NAD(P)-dependent dehydrogenase (short-subunit alcohol dehydrogenase family)
MTTLSGKTTLVTGASRGMGRASALALARQAPKFSCMSKKPTASSPRYGSVRGACNETHVTPLRLRLPVLAHHDMLRRGR